MNVSWLNFHVQIKFLHHNLVVKYSFWRCTSEKDHTYSPVVISDFLSVEANPKKETLISALTLILLDFGVYSFSKGQKRQGKMKLLGLISSLPLPDFSTDGD